MVIALVGCDAGAPSQDGRDASTDGRPQDGRPQDAAPIDAPGCAKKWGVSRGGSGTTTATVTQVATEGLLRITAVNAGGAVCVNASNNPGECRTINVHQAATFTGDFLAFVQLSNLSLGSASALPTRAGVEIASTTTHKIDAGAQVGTGGILQYFIRENVNSGAYRVDPASDPSVQISISRTGNVLRVGAGPTGNTILESFTHNQPLTLVPFLDARTSDAMRMDFTVFEVSGSVGGMTSDEFDCDSLL